MSDTALVVVTGIAMVLGVAGTVLPLLPGLWLIWVAGLVYAFASDAGTGGWVAMALLTILATAGSVVTIALPHRSGSTIGLPLWGQAVAALLAVIGFFVVPVLGAAIGFVLGVVLAMVARTNDLRSALPAAWSVIRAMLVASAIQFATGIVMVAVWIAWVVVD